MSRPATIAIAITVAIFAAATIWWRSGRERRAKTAATAAALRDMVLSRRMLADLPRAATPDAVRGAVMDWNIGTGLATLIAIDDGTVSMYLNPGGGVIGAGTHTEVAQVAERFRAEAARHRHLFTPSVDYRPPGSDSVAFFLLTDAQTLTSGAIASSDLQQPTHPLATLGALSQQLFSAVRKAR